MGSVGWGDVAEDNVNNDDDDDVGDGENYDAANGMVKSSKRLKKYCQRYYGPEGCVQLREGIQKNRLFLGKSPKLWVGGGQES